MNAAYEQLIGALAGGPDLSTGLCVGNWQDFDNVDDAAVIAKTSGMCRRCPVLTECSTWSSRYTNGELAGMVATKVRPWDPRSPRRRVS